ncbi:MULTISPECIES: hypothetical protein [unclassified Bartonella]
MLKSLQILNPYMLQISVESMFVANALSRLLKKSKKKWGFMIVHHLLV